jgi:branched-chain amino acid transport system permease protein
MHGHCGLFFTSYRAEEAVFPSPVQRVWLYAFLAVYLCLPFFLNAYLVSILDLIHIAIIAAVSLNLLTGCCGQISLGHGAFLGVGAFAAGALSAAGWPFPLDMLAGGAAAALVGLFFGLPSLRLKGIYLAIATLAAQIILEYVFLHAGALTGGSNGLLVEPASLFGYAFDTDQKFFYPSLAVAAASLLAVTNIMRSRAGRAFVAIRDYYLSAEIVGVNLFAYKLKAFAVSSFMAGMAGALWAHYLMYITPEQFNIGLSISYLAMIIIGGLGSVLGSVFGAVFITVLPEVLSAVAGAAGQLFPDVSSSLLAMKQGVFGLVLVLFLIFEPEGLVHRWRLVKAYWKLYPFAH